jgi:hypothetical protein
MTGPLMNIKRYVAFMNSFKAKLVPAFSQIAVSKCNVDIIGIVACFATKLEFIYHIAKKVSPHTM